MDLEFSVSNVHAKARAIAALLDDGYHAESGPVRLAYPFVILVADVPDSAHDEVQRLVAGVDPCVGRIAVVSGNGSA